MQYVNSYTELIALPVTSLVLDMASGYGYRVIDAGYGEKAVEQLGRNGGCKVLGRPFSDDFPRPFAVAYTP